VVAAVEPISLILTALAAGAAKGSGESATSAVKDAYTGLRDALRRRFADKPAARSALEQYAAEPDDDWRATLETFLARAGADRDEAILAAAAAVMNGLDPEGARAGTYVVNLAGASGVQVGNQNTQTNYFGPPR
jgi:hypothetical protein